VIKSLEDIVDAVRLEIRSEYERADAIEAAVDAMSAAMGKIGELEPFDTPHAWRTLCTEAEHAMFSAWKQGKTIVKALNTRIQWLEDELVRLQRLTEYT
jgi:hypothetical protein